MAGFVYIAINKAFPNIVKIGFTAKEPTERLDELARPTGVPEKYVLHNGAKFSDESHARKVEQLLLKAFHPKKFGNKREFFEIQPEEAMDALRLFLPGGVELKKGRGSHNRSLNLPTPRNIAFPPSSTLKSKVPNKRSDIPMGAELQGFYDEKRYTCVVETPGITPRVRYKNRRGLSLTAAAKLINKYENTSGTEFWRYGNVKISELRRA